MPQKKPFNKYLRSGYLLLPQEISAFYLNFFSSVIATEKMRFSLRDPDRMCSLRCIQSATISLDCPYLGLLGSYITNSYVPMGFQMFVGGFGAPKCFKNKRLSKNIIFKPKSLHKTLGFGRCQQGP